MESRSVRALRSVVSATLATFVAAAFHVVGGGANPGLTTLLLALAASVLVCLALSSLRLSLWRLAVSVVVSQAGFHLLFQVTGSSSTLAVHQHGADDPSVDAVLGHASAPMGIAHLIAAAITVAALARGEHALRALVEILARIVLRVVSPPLLTAVESRDGARRPALDPTPRVPAHLIAATPLQRRGPPLFV